MVNSFQSVNEGDGSVWICVDSGITGLVQTELVVTLSSIAGTASMLYIAIYIYIINTQMVAVTLGPWASHSEDRAEP